MDTTKIYEDRKELLERRKVINDRLQALDLLETVSTCKSMTMNTCDTKIVFMGNELSELKATIIKILEARDELKE